MSNPKVTLAESGAVTQADTDRSSVFTRFKGWADTFDSIQKFLAGLGSIIALAFFLYLAWKGGLLGKPLNSGLTINDLQATKITTILSSDLAKAGSFDNYAFDASGNRFNYRTSPPRSGYIIQYSGNVSGVGECNINFWIQNEDNKQIVIPSTNIEGVAIIQKAPISHEFFVEKATIVAHPLLLLSIGGESGTVQTEPVSLAKVAPEPRNQLASR